VLRLVLAIDLGRPVAKHQVCFSAKGPGFESPWGCFSGAVRLPANRLNTQIGCDGHNREVLVTRNAELMTRARSGIAFRVMVQNAC
jgi:hypothetical protein